MQNEGNQKPQPLATLVGFRFAFIYLALYIFPFPYSRSAAPPHWLRALWLRVTPWVGTHLLGVTIRPGFGDLGDAADEYIRILVLLGVAALCTLIWSIADRRRPNYNPLHEWFRIYVRLFLAGEMVGYGMEKILPVQFKEPALSTLLARFGEMSPASLLWASMGATRIYSFFGGLIEVLGGLLLFIPRLSTVGALVCVGATTNVLAVNLGYDINVKQYSFHLLLLAVFLIIPSLRSLADLLVFQRKAYLDPPQPFFHRAWLNRAVLLLQLTYGGYVVVHEFVEARRQALQHQEVVTNIPFAGIWTVDEFRRNGVSLPPLTTDDRRWWRVIVQRDPFDFNPSWAIEMASGLRRYFDVELDNGATVIRLTPVNDDRSWFPESYRGKPPDPVVATFRLIASETGLLTLEGEFEGQSVRASLHRTDTQFLLLQRGFRWVSDRPLWTR